MLLGRTAFKFFMWNIINFVNVAFGGFKGWSDDDFKVRLGVSRTTIYNWNKELNSSSGHKEVNLDSVIILSNATGIRLQHIFKKLINIKTYPFDFEVSRREFQKHVFKTFVFKAESGLDQEKFQKFIKKWNK